MLNVRSFNLSLTLLHPSDRRFHVIQYAYCIIYVGIYNHYLYDI